jgi:bacteriocin-like protein
MPLNPVTAGAGMVSARKKQGNDMTDLNNTSDLNIDEISDNELDTIVGGSFDIEQVPNIGSQSSGAGAGKVTFNPFSITKHVDKASPVLFL